MLGSLSYQRYNQKYKVWKDRFDEIYIENKRIIGS